MENKYYSISKKTLVLSIIVLVVLLGAGYIGMEAYTSTSTFCGANCHTMTEQYEAWKGSKHKGENNEKQQEAACIDCHFLPGEKSTFKGKMIGVRHLAAYLVDPKAPIPKSAVIPDGACLRSGCHVREKFQDKEIKFTEKVTFKHKPHFEKDALAGQQLTCDSCHIKYSSEKHFEVRQDACFLCHFKEGKYNEGAAKCSLCHTVPTKSLQRQKEAGDADEEPITHQSLEKAKVPCQSCHLQHIQYGEGDSVIKESCRNCHSRINVMAKWIEKDLIHDKHVAGRTADCFDCHQMEQYAMGKDFLEVARVECNYCHPDQHQLQKLLLLGEERGEVSTTPGLMTAVNTNCKGCHISKEERRGAPVMNGSGKACVGCHTSEHEKMLADWRETMESEVKFVKDVEAEAIAALKDASGVISPEEMKEAEALFKRGQEYLQIVEYGNGVHNKKYSVMLLDVALTSFEDLIDLLKGGQ